MRRGSRFDRRVRFDHFGERAADPGMHCVVLRAGQIVNFVSDTDVPRRATYDVFHVATTDLGGCRNPTLGNTPGKAIVVFAGVA